MKVYHRTWSDVARLILDAPRGQGFQDGAKGFVWLASIPLESDEMNTSGGLGGGDISLELEMPEAVVTQYGTAMAASRYVVQHTVYKVPASIVNQYSRRFYSSNYQGMSLAEVQQGAVTARSSGDVVRIKRMDDALLFLPAFGGDDAERRHKWIELLAYQNWQAEGERSDRAASNWLTAEAVVDERIRQLEYVPMF